VVMSNNGGALTISTGAQSVLFAVPAVSSVSATGALSISTNGSTVSMGVPAVSMGMSNIGNTSGNSGTVSNQMIFAGGNNITLSQATGAGGATLSISGPAASTYSATVFGRLNGGGFSSASLGNSSIYIFPEILQNYVSGSMIKLPAMVTFSSSAFAAHTRGHTALFAVYSRHATNSTLLTQLYSTSYTAAVSANSNGTMAMSIITAIGNSTSYNTLTASSAGPNISASLHGARELIMPFATALTPGEYWFAVQNASSTAGASGNLLNVSMIVATTISPNQFGVSQSGSSNGIQRNLGYGVYSTQSAAMPAAISMTQIFGASFNPVIHFLTGTV